MADNYVLLDRIELNASAASVTFSNIPQTGYTDLKIVMSARGDAAYVNAGCFMQINSVTSGYSTKDLYGDGSSPASSTNPYGVTSKAFVGAIDNSGATANTFGNKEIYIPNYASSNQKSISTDSVIETNATTSYIDVLTGLCTTTAAITSLTFTLDSGNFIAGSTFSIYGVAALGTTPAIAPKANGGNVIATDGTYWYHAFLSSGTFTPQVGLTADVLVVAGGGGGAELGGGGGAGGLQGFTSQSLSATGYTVTVGAGGVGTYNGTGVAGGNGGNSQFGSLTASVGGGGGGRYDATGNSGGSGGGAGRSWTSAALGTSGQGNNGGIGNASYNTVAAGGGGAGAAGGNVTSGSVASNGGVGVSTYSSWSSATNIGQNVSGTWYLAGGGGGGALNTGYTAGIGGYGGGANGSNNATPADSGTANTGGGAGGGRGANGYGGNGGSGLVIVRYPIAS